MMYNYLNSNCNRKIEMCSKLNFNEDIAHPDRILPVHDLVYVLNGGFNVIIENELIECRQGDIMFLPANKRHYPHSNNLKDTSCYFVHFSQACGDNLIQEKPISINDNFYCIPSKIKIRDSANLIYHFHELSSLSSMDNPNNHKLLNGILNIILCQIDLEFFQKNIIKYNKLTSNIISILEENLDKKISIDYLSKLLSYSQRTIQKNFKDNTGKTIHEYHLELKLNNSKYFLLSYPNMKLKEIGIMFGFYDEFHYSKSFKKHYKISPNTFRENHM